MKAPLFMIALSLSAPAAAESYTVTQLLGYGFEVKAAVSAPPGGKPAADILYLQGKLPSASREIIARCIVRPDERDGADNCQRVF